MNFDELSSKQILQLSKEDLEKSLMKFAEKIIAQQYTPSRWVTVDSAKKIIGIKSSTTLFKLKNEGKIAYTQPSKKILLFDRQSILDFLEENKQNTF